MVNKYITSNASIHMGNRLNSNKISGHSTIACSRYRILVELRRRAYSYKLELDYRSITNLDAMILCRILSQDEVENMANDMVSFLFKQILKGPNYNQVSKIFEWAYNENC